MPSQLDICNHALAELPSASIASLDEKSAEAMACARAYPQALQALLEFHPWSFANKRISLAAVTNDRASEWRFAYAMPTDCAMPLRIVPDPSVDACGPWRDWDQGLGSAYDLEGSTLYSWVENATLDYVSRDLAEARMTSMFADALALELASRIVMAIKKSRELKGDLIKQAEVAKQRAEAADMNRQPQRNAPYESEAGRARRSDCYGDRSLYSRPGVSTQFLTDQSGGLLEDG
jgi:hypothetical protein